MQKGYLLIVLDQTTAKNDDEQARADLAVAESNLRQQQNNYERSGELFEKKLISEQERDQSSVEKVRAEAQLVKGGYDHDIHDADSPDDRSFCRPMGIFLLRFRFTPF